MDKYNNSEFDSDYDFMLDSELLEVDEFPLKEGDTCWDEYSTLSESFESSGGIITDSEYEVNCLNEEKKD